MIHSDEGLSQRLTSTPSIFLAGPSPRGYGDGFPADWRDKAFELFKEMGYDGRLFVPRPTSGNSSDYDGQIEWELHHLDLADIIMFWVPRDLAVLPAFTTNVELGLYVKSGRAVYGRPVEAPKNRYLDHIYKKYTGREPFDNLVDTIADSILRARASVAALKPLDRP